MSFIRLLLRRQSLLVLAISLLVAGLLGTAQALLYQYFHQLDCQSAGARNHPLCTPHAVLLLNGRIHTPGQPGTVQALAVKGGIIEALGTSDELKTRYPDAPKVDLNGFHAWPGFHDVWTNLIQGGLGVAQLDLQPATDQTRFNELLTSALKKNPDAPWIFGQGWSVVGLGGQPPTRKSLDATVPDRPVFLWRADGRAAALNSKALSLLGIEKKTADVPGGRIDRDRSGVPSGLLEGVVAEQAFARALELLPSSDRKKALLAAQEYLLARGVTRVGDVQVLDLSQLVGMGELYEAGMWRLRVRAYPPAVSPTAWAFSLYESPNPDVLEVAAPLLTIDGGIPERQAALTSRYADGAMPGALRLDAAAVTEILEDSARPAPLLLATGDRALEAALQGLEGARQTQAPLVMSFMWSEQSLARARQLGLVPVLTPVFAQADWPGYRPALPDALMPLCFRFKSLASSAQPAVIGSGWPVTPVYPLRQLQAVVSNQDPVGEPIMPSWHEGQLLTLDQAMAAYTLNPARAIGRGNREGSLEVGKVADLVVLDRDITTRSPMEYDTTQVVMTILGGEVVWRREGGLQLRIEPNRIKRSPSWLKVIARQHFPFILLFLAIFNWPFLTAIYWVWRLRPRPEPLKVIVPTDTTL